MDLASIYVDFTERRSNHEPPSETSEIYCRIFDLGPSGFSKKRSFASAYGVFRFGAFGCPSTPSPFFFGGVWFLSVSLGLVFQSYLQS